MQYNKFTGFDFLRAVFAISVVALHTNLFVFLTGKLRLAAIADVLNFNFFFLAVPVFFLISLFLFFLKSEEEHQYFLRKRFAKLIQLYLFWVILKQIFDMLILHRFDKVVTIFLSLNDFIAFIISGGYSAFYFFFSLLFLTMLSAGLNLLLRKIQSEQKVDRLKWLLLGASCILVLTLSLVVSGNTKTYNLLTAMVQNLWFLPYILVASITWKDFTRGSINLKNIFFKFKFLALVVLFFVLTSAEWVYFKESQGYARLSLVVGAWICLYLALLSTQEVPVVVQFFSKCSLGIYGFHVFFLEVTPTFESFSEFLPGLGPIVRFSVVLFGSIFLTLFSRRIKILKAFI